MNIHQAMAAYGTPDKVRFPSYNGADDSTRPDTTFFADFLVAECEGIPAIRNTYARCKEWQSNAKYWTELTVILNQLLWLHYNAGEEEFARVYDQLWRDADQYAADHFTGDDAKHYYAVTD